MLDHNKVLELDPLLYNEKKDKVFHENISKGCKYDFFVSVDNAIVLTNANYFIRLNIYAYNIQRLGPNFGKCSY